MLGWQGLSARVGDNATAKAWRTLREARTKRLWAQRTRKFAEIVYIQETQETPQQYAPREGPDNDIGSHASSQGGAHGLHP